METKCIMCGIPHTGKYVICDTCINEYNLTPEQITEMGGLRTDDTEDKSGNIKVNNSDESTATITGAGTQDTTNTYSDQQQIIEKRDSGENTSPESYTNVLYHIAHALDTIKSIVFFYFVITIIGLVIFILSVLSTGH